MAKQNRGDFYPTVQYHLFRRFKIQYGAVWRVKYLRFRYWLMTHLFSPYKHTSGFASYDLFRRHYRKHVIQRNEFGSISQREYARRADKIWGGVSVPVNISGPPHGPLEQCTREHDGAFLRYNNPLNELGILHGRMIGTFFRPTNGRSMFLDECRR